MSKKQLFYLLFFIVLLFGFYFALTRFVDFSRPKLAVLKDRVPSYNLIDQNGRPFTQAKISGKVHVVEYFFTTCTNICPIMNANLRRVYDKYKNNDNVAILSHTCMPEVDTVGKLKLHEEKYITGILSQKKDNSYTILDNPRKDTFNLNENKTWYFLTGNKESLYRLAHDAYLVDDIKNPLDMTKPMKDQFIHTQHVAVLDKQQRVRKIYNALDNDEMNELIKDIEDLIKEKIKNSNFVGGFGVAPQ